MDPRTYANNADEIIPRLWLGNFNAARDETFIRTQQIQVVFNCTKDLPFSPLIPTKYRVPVDDNLEEEEIRNMSLWSTEIVYKLLKHYQQGERILVHCMAGRQRSAAAVAVLLIALNNWKSGQAMMHIRSKRQIAFFPQPNFLRSIQYFESKYWDEIMPIIREYVNKNKPVEALSN